MESKYINQRWGILIDTQSKKHPARLLRPIEFELILEGCKIASKSNKIAEQNQIRLKTALITGMRYGELQKLIKNPKWYDERSNVIFLPNETKTFRTSKRRYIRLPDIAREILPRFFELNTMPSIQGWIKNIKRWALAIALDPSYLCARTTRKTWESWLVATGHDTLKVALSQGHTEDTMLKHYLGIPFSEEDKREMYKWVKGWE